MVFDRRLWRKTLALNHPDRGGDEEVYKFLSALRDEQEEIEERRLESVKNLPSHPIVPTVQAKRKVRRGR